MTAEQDYAELGVMARAEDLQTVDLVAEILFTIALARENRLDTYTALLAALMVADGVDPREAVNLAVEDAHDPRTRKAADRARQLLAEARKDVR